MTTVFNEIQLKVEKELCDSSVEKLLKLTVLD